MAMTVSWVTNVPRPNRLELLFQQYPDRRIVGVVDWIDRPIDGRDAGFCILRPRLAPSGLTAASQLSTSFLWNQ
jgi:hypothetical protein